MGYPLLGVLKKMECDEHPESSQESLTNYYEYSNKMAGYDLRVIDDFGLMDLNLDKCRDLFEIIEARDCRKSTVIISQMPVANWYQLFGDNTYADACLSRMTSKAYRLDFPGRDRRVESK